MDDNLKLIAFYLPQFHPIPENDLWWGKGFTEWINVTKAYPNFKGHYQPHLPADLGFYDLRVPEIREQQAALAKQYGIYGFCYHHYWFGGKRLLERPFNEVLKSGKPDFPFCLCWANENWTRRWDGAEHQILIEQKHSPEDDLAFITDIIPAFKDHRYIRINNKPLLIVYRINLLPFPKQTIDIWQNEARKQGFDGIYLVAALSFGITDPTIHGFDAAVEFPPHNARGTWINDKVEITNPEFNGNIFDYSKVASNHILQDLPVETTFTHFHTVMPSWDNTARRQNFGHVFYNSSPENYYRWLKYVLNHTRKLHKRNEQFVFINAWNEWAEGCHLEPDQQYGHAYLEATYQSLNSDSKCDLPLNPVFSNSTIKNKSNNNLQLLLRTTSNMCIPGLDELIKKEISGIIIPCDFNNYIETLQLINNCKSKICIEIKLNDFSVNNAAHNESIFNKIFNILSLSNYITYENKHLLFITQAGLVDTCGFIINQLSFFLSKQGIHLFKSMAIADEISSGLLKKEHGSFIINHSTFPAFDSVSEIQPDYCLSVMKRMGYSDISDNNILNTIPNIPERHDNHFMGFFLPENADHACQEYWE